MTTFRTRLAVLALAGLLLSRILPAEGAQPAQDSPTAQAQPQALVLLDAGHGGDDLGVRVDGTDEASLALDLAKRLGAALEAGGCRVAYTRDSASGVSQEARARMANSLHPACMVSLHYNFSFSPAARGWRVFVPPAQGKALALPGQGENLVLLSWDQAQSQSAALSHELGAALSAALDGGSGPKRGVQVLRLAPFRGVSAPVAVVEAGFLSQPEELKQARDEASRQALALRLAAGVQAYLHAHAATGGR
jgi:N-acetylmuramoyl-L-alanine amidase